jgi:hypothetical protein
MTPDVPKLTVDLERPNGSWQLNTPHGSKDFYIYDVQRNQVVMKIDETTGTLTVYVGAVMPDTYSKKPAIIKRVVVRRVGDSK